MIHPHLFKISLSLLSWPLKNSLVTLLVHQFPEAVIMGIAVEGEVDSIIRGGEILYLSLIPILYRIVCVVKSATELATQHWTATIE